MKFLKKMCYCSLDDYYQVEEVNGGIDSPHLLPHKYSISDGQNGKCISCAFYAFNECQKLESGDLISCPNSGPAHCERICKSFKTFVLGFLIM